MNKFIKRTQAIIFSKQSSILSSAILLSLMISLSRLFGFFRYRILAGFFTKEELDIFFASFRIPDLIFEILITGALTTTFIPIFVKYQKNKEDCDINISSIINFILILMILLIIILLILLDKIIIIITPGYPQDKTTQIISFSRILLLGQLPFLILGNFLTGIAQANKIFILSAIAPLVYNLAIIIATLFLANHLFLLAPVFGTVLGAVLFLIIQVPILFKSRFTYHFIIKKTKALSEFIRLVLPRTITVIASQIDATVDLVLTTLLGPGAYTVFYFAQHLQLLPISVIGIAFGQAALPYLSEIYQEKNTEDFKKIVVNSILNLFFLTIPIASFFIFARTPLTRLFFGGQKFDWEATVQTATTLSYFAFSIPVHTIYYFLTRCFYALLDSKTPFFISIASIAVNTFLSFFFIFFLHLPVWSLAISFSMATFFNVLLLFIFLYIKLKGLNYQLIIIETLKMVIVVFFSSFVVYFLMRFLDGLIFDTSRTINVFFLLLSGGIIYFILYLFISWIIDVKEIYLLTKLLIKAKEYQRKIIEICSQYE
ncbi:MAG: murein biosynthesis integral membrane protein MurJ [Microgenomates group bacterium]